MRKARTHWSAALAVLTLAIAACGAPVPEGDDAFGPAPSGPIDQESTGPSEGETQEVETRTGTPVPPNQVEPHAESRPHDHPTPPDATLRVNEASQTAGLGTYCWSGDGAGLCVDKIGVPTPQEPLLASSPVHAAFDIREGPRAISLSVIPAESRYEVDGHGNDWRWWQTGEPLLTQDLVPDDPRTELAIEPGTYVVSLFVRWPQSGDATYGFLVKVE